MTKAKERYLRIANSKFGFHPIEILWKVCKWAFHVRKSTNIPELFCKEEWAEILPSRYARQLLEIFSSNYCCPRWAYQLLKEILLPYTNISIIFFSVNKWTSKMFLTRSTGFSLTSLMTCVDLYMYAAILKIQKVHKLLTTTV